MSDALGNSAADFKVVTFEKERIKAFESLSTSDRTCSLLFRDRSPLFAKVKNQTGSVLVIEIQGETVAPALKEGESCEILFSLPEGQYFFTSKIRLLGPTSIGLSTAGELRKLQRRNNFRVSIPANFSGTFTLIEGANQQAVTLVDLSVGGAKFRCPAQSKIKLEIGKSLSGIFRYEKKEIEVGVSIRTVADAGTVAGAQFSGLSGPDEQSLLFLCLQLQRGQSRFSL